MRWNFLPFCCPRGSDTATLLTSFDDDNDNETSFSAFDFLPDEVILHIFSYFTNGEPLLDAVPLVCRRWRCLARDPLAWSNVEVWLTPARTDYDINARTLLHAPAVARLELLSLDEGLLSALRRSNFVVLRQLDARGLLQAGATKEAVDLVLAVAWRSRHHLRSVNLHLSAAQPQSNKATLLHWMQSRQRDAFDVLAGLHRLRELHLSFPKDAPLLYTGELDAGLPGLQVLTVDVWRNDATDRLIFSLLRGAAPTLRVLRLWLKNGSGSPLQAVAQCAGLQHLSVLGCSDNVGLADLRRMRGLTNLRLLLFARGEEAALAHLADVRTLCYDLPLLQKVWISFAWNYLKAEHLKEALAECASLFSQCRPEVNATWDTV